MRKPWFVCFVAIAVALVPLAMWFDRHQGTQDRKDRETETVVAQIVVDQGNDKMVSVRYLDERITVQYPGRINVGDELDIYLDDRGQWQAIEQSPLWVPVAASLLLWVPAAVVLWKYVPMLRRRRRMDHEPDQVGPVGEPR